MVRIERRKLLQVIAGGLVGASWIRSDRTRVRTVTEPLSQEDPPADPDDFDPAVHGFGFSNWAGDTGADADGEQFNYEPVDVTKEEVQRAIENSWTTALSRARESLMTRIVYSWIGGNAATNGHCYGMAFSAEEYFETQSELPHGVDAASEIPRPTDRYGGVGDRVRKFQTSQILRAEPFWFAFLGFRWGLADQRESLDQLTNAIDATGSAGLALNGEGNAHQVLAYGYERTDDVTDVSIYDPNYQATDHIDSDDVWMLSVDRESGDVLEIGDGYDEFLYHHPEMDLSVADRLIGGRDHVLNKLSDAVFLGLESGGTLNIDAVEDALVDRPAAEYADSNGAPYADAAVVLGSLEEFEISIDGEAGTEYSLDAFGLRDGDPVLDEIVSNTLGEVPVQLRFQTGDAGEFAVDVIEDAKESTAEAAEEAGETTGNGTEEIAEETAWIEDNRWLAAIGGTLGLGAAFRYLVGSSAEDDET